ncbi:helix-turn-helix transcriptional regulator [Vibrio rumoiensis]|uniref:HTH luxR-type domain-containing protein n=1 Tax=Vibrio rumoiensis 1S-45 TaxID=1188252 RepID=A0A1E5E297_9VIBR|nr:LuxR C-terminal-related transcriptional regulator [Vibrio rumoiensis]OEF25140.1 hypothetical protein A1QC_09665 [Vibrio rumoiensis 1S-45]
MESHFNFQTFEKLISNLYLSPTNTDHFQSFLDSLVETFQLSDAILHIESNQPDAIELKSIWIAGPTSYAILQGVDQNLLDLNYFGQFMLKQPVEHFYGWMLDQGRYPDNFDNYRYKPIHDWFDSHQFIDIAGCIFKLDHCHVFFHAHRQHDVGIFTQKDIAAFNALVPHIKQALNLYFHLKSAVYSEYDYSILDFVHHPSILCHKNGDVLYANESAKRLLALYENIELTSNDLTLDTPAKTNQLKIAVLRASITKPGDNEHSIITLETGSYPLTLLVMPVKHNRGAHLSGAIVYFYDKESSIVVNLDIIALIFNLTKIEVSICELMILGISRDVIAEEINRSIHTVKDYIKSIYLKVGANSQTELISTLLKFPVFPV